MTSRLLRFVAVLAVLALAACMPSRREIRQAQEEVRSEQDTQLTCDLPDHCALSSPLYDLAEQALSDSTPDAPRHRLVLLENGQDALLARINLIRAARASVDMQSFIYSEDDAGFLVLEELIAAARRGVKVRLLLDQLYSFEDLRLLAWMARAHVNFELRLFNPTFGKANTGPLEWVAGIVCCFTRFNQRMHNKLLLVDGVIGISGGRNYQNRYFDWDPEFNYRDRDLIVAGPVAGRMQRAFDRFWKHRRTVPVAALSDVRKHLQTSESRVRPEFLRRWPARIDEMSQRAGDALEIAIRFANTAFDVGRVDYLSDWPNKTFERTAPDERDLSLQMQRMFMQAQRRILLQTPYLVFSDTAQQRFRELRRREHPPRIVVSTNSLAATDAFPVYALSHKYKRRYLREFGMTIYEYKPFPGNAPIAFTDSMLPEEDNLPSPGEGASEGRRAFGSASNAGSGSGPGKGRVKLARAGVRMGMHAKSMVIDEDIALVGTHNFDPRSDRLNTEAMVVVHDSTFAAALAENILIDTRPENAWVIAPRPKPAVLSGLNYSLGKAFEALPLFDVWPFRYATSWEMVEGCSPLRPDEPGFTDCYRPVGDFPEVDVPGKTIYTRVLTAFGAGLAPIL
jgi:putative cardiolipin synthase